MKRTLLFITVMILFAGTARAQVIVTHADVTVPISCATVLAASAKDPLGNFTRICVDLSNTGGDKARCGDANSTAGQGSELLVGASKTFCITGPITCCAENTSTTIAPTETKSTANP